MTNVGDVDLTAAGATSHAGVETAAAAVRATAHAALESAASGAARRAKARLGLTVLFQSQSGQVGPQCVGELPYLSDIDEPAHKVLVAECRYGLLCLLPRGILHNSVRVKRSALVNHPGPLTTSTYPHP